MKILGIETSCDETAAAVVDGDKNILSNVIYSQTAEHAAYGGVVPEIASRAHIDNIEEIVKKALQQAKTDIKDIDAIAVTAGPGLIGGVIVGLMFAKGLAAATQKPLICVNHLEGHALTCRLTDNVEFPYLLLLVSGGHCQFIICEAVGKYKIIGQTMDDALGEAFDKTAKMLGLGYPGGPMVEKLALEGDENRFKFTLPLQGNKNAQRSCDFSFSGLKTAVLREVESLKFKMTVQDKKDVCASFQKVACDSILDRLNNAVEIYLQNYAHRRFVISGGVAANKYIGDKIKNFLAEKQFEFYAPPLKLCTDNAAMIAWAGAEKFKLGMKDELNFMPRARWSLES
jgi:N6-L-threonylcarbamoyladenine synthase